MHVICTCNGKKKRLKKRQKKRQEDQKTRPGVNPRPFLSVASVRIYQRGCDMFLLKCTYNGERKTLEKAPRIRIHDLSVASVRMYQLGCDMFLLGDAYRWYRF